MTKAMHRSSLITSKLRRLCCSGSSFLHFLLIRSNQSIEFITKCFQNLKNSFDCSEVSMKAANERSGVTQMYKRGEGTSY